MWLISTVTSRRAMFNYASSGQTTSEATQVETDGILFANAVERTSWSAATFQVEVCEQCGIEGCSSGGWLVCRRSGNHVLFMPAFERMVDDEHAHFAPPSYVRSRGIPAVSRDFFDRTLRPMIPTLPEFDRLLPLMRADARRILQWEAPLALLGKFPEEPFYRESSDVLAVSHGSIEEWTSKLNDTLTKAPPKAEIELREKDFADTTVEFYIDNPVQREWRPLVVSSNQDVRLLFEPNLVAHARL